MENARLRADLASQIALECVRATLTLPPAGTPSASVSLPASGAGATAAAASATAPAAAAAAEAAAKYQAALAAKDDLVKRLQREVGSARTQALSYENRWGLCKGPRSFRIQLTRISSV